jgi:hypothetical protein
MKSLTYGNSGSPAKAVETVREALERALGHESEAAAMRLDVELLVPVGLRGRDEHGEGGAYQRRRGEDAKRHSARFYAPSPPPE